MKIFRRILLALVIVLITAAAVTYLYLRSTLPVTRGVILTSAVKAPVEIRRNDWGVPFIRAGNEEDLFVAIGFVHAQDRLFQMDLSRRLAAGRLSEIFGRRMLEVDIASLEQQNEEATAASMLRFPARLRRLAERYCDGINLFLSSQRLPPEFRALGYRPEKWQLQDLFAILKNMESVLTGSGGELGNMLLAAALGEEAARRLYSGPAGTTIIKVGEVPPPGIRPGGNGSSAAHFPAAFSNPVLQRAWLRECELREMRLGSNNWAAAGSRTESGLPFLASDPHLPNRFPAYFYEIHATAPDIELCGNTLPGVPLVIIGRNADLAWGLTALGTDAIDYFRLTLNPANADQYLLDGKWLDFRKVRHTIRIRGGGQRIHEVKVSFFGPLRREGGVALAEHSIGAYPSTALEAFFEMNMARNAEEFLAGVRKFSSPAHNVVFADRRGDIGYFPAGRIPRRPRGDGTLPVRGETSADVWQGFVDESAKPFLLNPRRGIIVAANNEVLPAGGSPVFSGSTNPAFRAARIEELLQEKDKLTLADMRRIQTDTRVIPAEYLIARIGGMAPASPQAAFVLERLRRWNLRAEPGIEPYLFYVFERRLADNVFADHFADAAARDLISTSWLYKILGYPEKEPLDLADLAYWADDVRTPAKETFADMVEKSLIETEAEFQAGRMGGKNPDWSVLHTITYAHPLGSIGPLRPLLNRGPHFMAGGRECVMTSSFGRRSFTVSHMSALRMIVDFSDFSRSLLVNSSGQSGHFLSPYYSDQIPLYTSGRYRPMESPPGQEVRPLILRPAPRS